MLVISVGVIWQLLLVNMVQLVVICIGVIVFVFSVMVRQGGCLLVLKLNCVIQVCVFCVFISCSIWMEIMFLDLVSVCCIDIGFLNWLLQFLGFQGLLLVCFVVQNNGVLFIIVMGEMFFFSVVEQMKGLKLELGWCYVCVMWLNLFFWKLNLFISDCIFLLWGFSVMNVDFILGNWVMCQVFELVLIIWIMVFGWILMLGLVLLDRLDCVGFKFLLVILNGFLF